MRRYGMSDDQWLKIENLLPGRKETVGVTAKNNRLFEGYACFATQLLINKRLFASGCSFSDYSNCSSRAKYFSMLMQMVKIPLT